MRVAIEGAVRGDRLVLGPIDLDLGPTEVVAVLGPSGIGKSTLLRVIAGLAPATGGAVTGAGRVGMVFQAPTLLPWRTLTANLTIATGCPAAKAVALLDAVGLSGRHDAYPGALSLGQQRRVALARAFALAPDTLLLDEPFVSLDGTAARRMERLLADLLEARPTRAILVTHASDEAARLATRVVRLGGAPAGVVADVMLTPPPAGRDPEWIAATAARLAAG